MRWAPEETGDTLSTIVVSGGDAHCPQRVGGFCPSRMMPSWPAIGMKPCVVFAGPERHNLDAPRFNFAAPSAASGKGLDGVRVQPFNDTVLECLDLSLNGQQAAVMLQKARTFVEARSPVLRRPYILP